ncbi:2-hydroxyacid dehydrogenase [Primorskyibacter sp. S87]|uniref:2-hydroxyacid dehydrogenase n=1 Tax=Primorskyibacter sp. S87 TaxID=3415126 RepID=UPI003C7C9FBD
MRLLLARPLPETVENRARAFDTEFRNSNAPMSKAEMKRALTEFDVVMPTLGDLFSSEIFDAVPTPRCKLLANFGVGYNHIDAVAARMAGIDVTNTPGAVTDATADIAMTLILMSNRRAGEGERMVRAGNWDGWHPTQMLGQHVTGLTVGILGMGRIGQAIARRCHFGFGMKIRYVARSPKTPDFPAERASDPVALASSVDVLVAAVPGGADTRHLVGDTVFKAMKPSAHFINISRGDVVNEAALVAALEAGEISGAGLDVYEFEPKVSPALIQRENVVLLPHLGTAALNVRTDMGMMVMDNVEAFAAGHLLPNPV